MVWIRPRARKGSTGNRGKIKGINMNQGTMQNLWSFPNVFKDKLSNIHMSLYICLLNKKKGQEGKI